MADVRIERVMSLQELRSREPRDMFSGRDLYRVRVSKGSQLYKLTDGEAASGGRLRLNKAGFTTPWWLLYESQQILSAEGAIVVLGVEAAVARSRLTGASVSDFLRSHAAVDFAWGNPMTHLLLVELQRPAVGLMGKASTQRWHGKSRAHQNVHFMGGSMQLYLPCLTAADVAVISLGQI